MPMDVCSGSPHDSALTLRYQAVLEKLVSYLEQTSEYIEIFGIAIDRAFRNALISLACSGLIAGLSALVALVPHS